MNLKTQEINGKNRERECAGSRTPLILWLLLPLITRVLRLIPVALFGMGYELIYSMSVNFSSLLSDWFERRIIPGDYEDSFLSDSFKDFSFPGNYPINSVVLRTQRCFSLSGLFLFFFEENAGGWSPCGCLTEVRGGPHASFDNSLLALFCWNPSLSKYQSRYQWRGNFEDLSKTATERFHSNFSQEDVLWWLKSLKF